MQAGHEHSLQPSPCFLKAVVSPPSSSNRSGARTNRLTGNRTAVAHRQSEQLIGAGIGHPDPFGSQFIV